MDHDRQKLNGYFVDVVGFVSTLHCVFIWLYLCLEHIVLLPVGRKPLDEGQG